MSVVGSRLVFFSPAGSLPWEVWRRSDVEHECPLRTAEVVFWSFSVVCLFCCQGDPDDEDIKHECRFQPVEDVVDLPK